MSSQARREPRGGVRAQLLLTSRFGGDQRLPPRHRIIAGRRQPAHFSGADAGIIAPQRRPPNHQRLQSALMPPAVRPWLILALTLGYLSAAHFALVLRSTPLATVATAALALLLVASIQGRHRTVSRVLAAIIGAGIVVLIANGAPPVPLLLPPVLIPASISWMFGRTLRTGRTPLVERIARGFHAPEIPAPEIIAYARGVTWAWSLLLGLVAAVNAWMILNLVPGGLLRIAGLAPPWPVAPETFAWFGNTGTYLLIGGMFVVEFTIRVWRFPDYRFRNPWQFIREARVRMPSIVASVRNG